MVNGQTDRQHPFILALSQSISVDELIATIHTTGVCLVGVMSGMTYIQVAEDDDGYYDRTADLRGYTTIDHTSVSTTVEWTSVDTIR